MALFAQNCLSFSENYLSFSVRWKAYLAEALRSEMAAIAGFWPFSKGRRAVRVSIPFLKHDLLRPRRSLNSASITGYRASARFDRPVFTNQVHLGVRPGIRQMRIGLADADFTDELIS